jgi:hypothetical protein
MRGPPLRLAPGVLALGVLALSGCGDAVGPDESGEPSSLSFSYEGAGTGGTISGTYRVEAEPDPRVELGSQSYAMGRRVRSAGALVAMSGLQRGDALSDFVWVTIPRLSSGSAAVQRDCGASYCPEIFVALEVRNEHGSQAKYSCSILEGTVRITGISEHRASGEFSGTGTCLGAPGATDMEQFSITDGRFDVKLRDVQS